MNSMIRHSAVMTVCAALLAMAGGVWAQPERSGEAGMSADPARQTEQDDRPVRARGERPPLDGTALRQWLQRGLERSRGTAERLEKAIADLDAGKSPREVVELLDRTAERGSLLAPLLGPGGLGGGPGGRDLGGAGPADGLFGGQTGGPPRPLSPDERAAVRSALADLVPDVARQLEEFAKREPRGAERLLNSLAGRLRGAGELRERDPELFELHREEIRNFFDVVRLTREVIDARREGEQGAERLASLREQVGQVVARQFDARLKMQARQVDDLHRRAEGLRKEIDKLRERRDQVIAERTDAIFRDAERGARGPEGRPGRERGDRPERGKGGGGGPDGGGPAGSETQPK